MKHHKARRIEMALSQVTDSGLPPHYLAFFECFNRQLFYEAHEVLEELWLQQRHAPDGLFYKGLIQFAGAFVHLQKGRPQPATALFKLALKHLKLFPTLHHRLDLAALTTMIEDWIKKVQQGEHVKDPLAPRLWLEL